MTRYLSLDIGLKRIGVAISTSGILCKEYATFENSSIENSINRIIEIIDKEKINNLIIGLPISMDNTHSTYTEYVLNFSKKIKEIINIPVILEDERLTTQEAERQLRELKISFNEIKERVDQYSAKLILEQYLSNK